jgi:hypothetical protein
MKKLWMSEDREAIYIHMILERKFKIKPEEHKMIQYPKHEIIQSTKSLSFYKELLLNVSNVLQKKFTQR